MDEREKRRADMAREESFDGFEAYLQHHRGEVAVEITQAEIDKNEKIRTIPARRYSTRGVLDVDPFFRALWHYSGRRLLASAKRHSCEDAIRAEFRILSDDHCDH